MKFEETVQKFMVERSDDLTNIATATDKLEGLLNAKLGIKTKLKTKVGRKSVIFQTENLLPQSGFLENVYKNIIIQIKDGKLTDKFYFTTAWLNLKEIDGGPTARTILGNYKFNLATNIWEED